MTRSPFGKPVVSPSALHKGGGELFGASTAAGLYLDEIGSEPSGFAVDFAQSSALVRGHTTNFSGLPSDLITVARTSAATYFDSTGTMQTALSNVLRLDHDPALLEPLGVRIERQSANLLTYSAQLDDPAWTKTRSSPSANAAAAPDGSTSADALVEDGTPSNTHHALQVVTTTAVDVTFSVFAEKVNRDWIALYNLSAGPTGRTAWFDLATGALGTVQGSGSSKIQYVGNDQYRAAFTQVAYAGSNNNIIYAASGNNTISFNGNSLPASYIWGAQLEALPYATSYIATTSAAATRSPDLLTLPVSSAPWNATGGMLVIEGRSPPGVLASGGQMMFQIDDGTDDNRIYGERAASTGVLTIYFIAGGVTQAALGMGALASNTNFNIAISWEADDFAASLDGATPVTDTGGTVPAGLTTWRFGSYSSGFQWDGTIKRLKHLPRPREDDAELQALSAPDPVSAAIQALFARFTTPPTNARKRANAVLYRKLADGGVLNRLDVLQLRAGADAQAASLNWKGATSTATVVNAPTFEADKGWLTNGSTQYVNTNFIGADGVNYLQDDAMHGVWSNIGARDAGLHGCHGAAPTRASASLGLYGTAPFQPTFSALVNANSSTSTWVPASQAGATIYGCVAVQRVSATGQELYAQGTRRATSSAYASTTRPTIAMFNGALNNAGTPASYFVDSVGAYFAGGALTEAQHQILNDALAEYMQSIGNYVTPAVAWGDSLSNNTFGKGVAIESDASGRAFRVLVEQGNSGETTSLITARMLADTTYNDHVQVIWAGRNDISNPAETVNTVSIKAGIASMVAAAQARSNKYVVLGVTTLNLAAGSAYSNSEAIGTTIGDAVATLNGELEVLYGDNFLDILSLIVSQGLLGDTDDQADAAAGVPPRSAMIDQVHFSQAFHDSYIGPQIELKMQALGY